jgi:hypothetical protein
VVIILKRRRRRRTGFCRSLSTRDHERRGPAGAALDTHTAPCVTKRANPGALQYATSRATSRRLSSHVHPIFQVVFGRCADPTRPNMSASSLNARGRSERMCMCWSGILRHPFVTQALVAQQDNPSHVMCPAQHPRHVGISFENKQTRCALQ